MSTRPKKPKILKVVVTDAFIKIKREVSKTSEQQQKPDPDKPGETKTKVVTSSSTHEEKTHEEPLPAFYSALNALAPVAVKSLGIDPSWKENITINAVSLTYNERNVRTAVIDFSKKLTLGTESKEHKLATPAFQIDDDKQGERRQCAEKHADLVIDFIKQAQRYADGERSQTLLDFEDEEEGDGEDDGQGQLPGTEPADDTND